MYIAELEKLNTISTMLYYQMHIYQRRIRMRGGQVGPASRPGAFRGGVGPKSPDYIPYVHLAGNDLH